LDCTLERVTVRREELTRFAPRYARRMDITIRLHPGVGMTEGYEPAAAIDVIMIENKPFCGEQDRQMEEYCDHLRRAHEGRFLMLYLSRDGALPLTFTKQTEHELRTAGRLAVLSYEKDIPQWLDSCETQCKAPRVQLFLRGLKKKVSATFVAESGGENTMITDEKAIIECALRNRESLEFVSEIGLAFENTRRKVISNFRETMRSWLEAELTSGWAKPDIDKPLWQKWTGMYIHKPGWPPGCVLYLETKADGWRGLRYGVAGKESDLKRIIDLNRLRRLLDKEFGLPTIR
jgi:hypothetical protein